MSMTIRATRIHVTPDGEPIFSERGFAIEIADDAAGEYLIVRCHDDQCEGGAIRVDPAEWAVLRDAIDQMVKECRV